MGQSRGALVSELRELALSLPEVEERSLYDGFCREWTPAYYRAGHQLFHVHNFRACLRATMFMNVKTLGPVIQAAETVSLERSFPVGNKARWSAPREMRVPLSSAQDVAAFMELVRAKWEALTP